MAFSTKIVDCIQPLTNFAKHFILGASQSYEYVSNKAKQNPGALSPISQNVGAAISANFFHFFFTLPSGETLMIKNSVHVSLISN